MRGIQLMDLVSLEDILEMVILMVPFIYTGFRPRLLAIKAFSSNYSEGWIVHDTARTTNNTSIKKTWLG